MAWWDFKIFIGVLVSIVVVGKVIHPKYYKHLKKGAYQSQKIGRQKMGWFLAD